MSSTLSRTISCNLKKCIFAPPNKLVTCLLCFPPPTPDHRVEYIENVSTPMDSTPVEFYGNYCHRYHYPPLPIGDRRSNSQMTAFLEVPVVHLHFQTSTINNYTHLYIYNIYIHPFSPHTSPTTDYNLLNISKTCC